ncbi:unnamed protein product [Mucor hiemalis]
MTLFYQRIIFQYTTNSNYHKILLFYTNNYYIRFNYKKCERADKCAPPISGSYCDQSGGYCMSEIDRYGDRYMEKANQKLIWSVKSKCQDLEKLDGTCINSTLYFQDGRYTII